MHKHIHTYLHTDMCVVFVCVHASMHIVNNKYHELWYWFIIEIDWKFYRTLYLLRHTLKTTLQVMYIIRFTWKFPQAFLYNNQFYQNIYNSIIYMCICSFHDFWELQCVTFLHLSWTTIGVHISDTGNFIKLSNKTHTKNHHIRLKFTYLKILLGVSATLFCLVCGKAYQPRYPECTYVRMYQQASLYPIIRLKFKF